MNRKINPGQSGDERAGSFKRGFFRLYEQIHAIRERKAKAQRASQEHGNRWGKFNTLATTGATVVIAFATIATTVVGCYQWQALHNTDVATRDLADAALKQAEAASRQVATMENQLGEMQKSSQQIERSIAAANRQADAADRANEIANAGILAADRPWVGVEAVQTPPLDANKDFTIKIVVKNSGRSPALSVHGTVKLGTLADTDPLPELPDECVGCAESVMFPNGALSYDLTVDAPLMDAERIDRIKKSTELIYLYGRFDYFDGGQRPHKTFICSIYLLKTGFVGCASGNHAD